MAATGSSMATTTSEFGENLVSVRAIVMTWDEKYLGWQSAEGGGVSNVTLYQRLSSTARDVGVGTESGEVEGAGPSKLVASPVPSYEYTVFGDKLEDKKVTIHCQLTKEVSYRVVMPTFHHWQIGERKYGLKFMTPHEALGFQNRVQKAMECLCEQSKPSSPEAKVERQDTEDEVFMPLEPSVSSFGSSESDEMGRSKDLKVETIVVPAVVHEPPSTLSSASTSVKKKKSVPAPISQSTSTQPVTPTSPWSAPSATPRIGISSAAPSPSFSYHYPQVYFQKEPSSVSVLIRPSTGLRRPPSATGLPLTSSFVQLASRQPARSVSMARSMVVERRESTSSLKVPLVYHHMPSPIVHPGRSERRELFGRKPTTPTSPAPSSLLRRERCRYCKAIYREKDNASGSCPSAPDACSKWIRRTTCIWCAECLVSGCCRGRLDGDALNETDVCSCSPDAPARSIRWLLIASLAVLVPCLCFYPLLALCHRSCRRRGLVGGRHRPSGSVQSSASASASRTFGSEISSGHK